jgi:hypothetical protein
MAEQETQPVAAEQPDPDVVVEYPKKILKEGRLVGKTVKPVAKPAESPKPAEPEQVVKKKKNNGEMILAALAAALLLV